MTWADMHILHPSIVDDTGARRTVHFANWSRVRAAADPGARFAIDAVARIVRPMRGRPGIITWSILGIFAIAAVAQLNSALHGRAGHTADVVMVPLSFLALCAWVLWYLPRWNLWRYGASIVPVLAARGICPCCAYSLKEVARTDGFVRCPECGSTWNQSRLDPADAAGSVRGGLVRIGTAASLRRGLLDDVGHRTFAILRTPRRAARDEPDASLRHRIRTGDAAVRRVSASARFAIIFGASLVLALATLDSVTGLKGLLTWPGLWEFVRGPGLVVLGMILVSRSYLGLSAPAARAQLLAHGLCPTCVSDLEHVAPGPEGARTCEVCGSAWKSTHEASKSTD